MCWSRPEASRGVCGGGCDRLTAEEAAVLEPPYNVRLDRPLVIPGEGDGALRVETRPRPAAKKEWDKKVFGTDYF